MKTKAQGEPIPPDFFSAAPTAAIAQRKHIVRFDEVPDLLTMNVKPAEWLIEDVLAKQTMTLWAGSDGVAKTFLMQSLAVAVATGGQWLGYQCHAAHVLFLDFENPAFVVQDRLKKIAQGPIPNLRIWGTWLEDEPPKVDSEVLLEIAREKQPLVIFDPFLYAHTADENSSREMGTVMQFIRNVTAAGATAIIVHHPARTEGSTGRGSTAIRGACDCAWLQEMSDENGLITLKCTKHRFAAKPLITVRADFEEGIFERTNSPQMTQRETDLEKLRKIIIDAPGMTQTAVWEKSGMGRNRAFGLLKQGKDSLWEAREETEHGRKKTRYYPSLVPPKSPVPEGLYRDRYRCTAEDGEGEGTGTAVPQSYRGTAVPCPDAPNILSGAVQLHPVPIPKEKTLSSCPFCGGFAINRLPDGGTICETCRKTWGTA